MKTNRNPWKDRYSFVEEEDGRPINMPQDEWEDLLALESAMQDGVATPEDEARYVAINAKMPDRVMALVLEMTCATRFRTH